MGWAKDVAGMIIRNEVFKLNIDDAERLREFDALERQLPALQQQLAALQAENAKLREAGKKLLMVTLPPHDVSGRAMYDEAKQVIHGN